MISQIALMMVIACSDTEPSKKTVTSTPPTPTETSAPPKKEVKKSVSATSTKPKVEPINNENWKQHPDIKEIRKLVSGYLSPESKVNVMSHTFDDMCGEKGILKVGLAYPGEGEPLAYFLLIETMGDVGRETKVFYDSKGDVRFVMSEYTHSSAESIYVSRAYYKNGGLIFSPQPEQTSENSGPKDEKKAHDLVILKATDAEQKFFAVAGECSPK